MIGQYAWEFVAAEYRESARDGIAKKLAREQPTSIFPRELRCADGSYLWVEIHESLIENAAGEVIGIRSGLFDITERRKFEMEIQRQHDRMKFLLQSWTRAIVTADALGRVDFMNPAAEKLTGWPQQDALGRPLESICRVLIEAGEAAGLMACILGEPAAPNLTRQSVIVDRAGISHLVSWSTSPILNDNAVIIGVALVFEKG